jgi:hypothetical protein
MQNQETKPKQDRIQWGGVRPGGGRPKGSRNTVGRVRIPKELREETVTRAAADRSVTREMYEAAQDLAPYRHPKLSAVAVQAAVAVTSLADVDGQVRELLAKGRQTQQVSGPATSFDELLVRVRERQQLTRGARHD